MFASCRLLAAHCFAQAGTDTQQPTFMLRLVVFFAAAAAAAAASGMLTWASKFASSDVCWHSRALLGSRGNDQSSHVCPAIMASVADCELWCQM
jgi:hypothetical protein